MQIFIFVLGLLCSIAVPSLSIEVQHSRRMLHQPLFPLDSLPPNSQPPLLSPQLQPQPKQQPKYPFSSASPPNKDNSFFPFYSSPPPPPSPPSTSLVTFPANISSIILPPTSSSKPISRKLVAIAVAVSLLAAALITGFAAFLLHYRRHRSFSKASRTDSIRLFPPNTVTSDGSPKPERENVSGTSSEFLCLGTLRGTDEGDQKAASSSNAGASSMQSYEKLGSPELHPLPPLPRQNFRQKYLNDEMDSSADDEEDEEEEFFSPTGSSGHKESPTVPGSSSPRVFMGIEEENFRSRSSNSRTASYPSLNSASPTNSMSSSPLMPLNLSARSFRSKSDFPPPSRPAPAIPIQTIAQSPPKSTLLSPSPPSTPQKRNSGQTQNSPARDSDVPVQYASVKLPPPPPPLPPPRFWEIPVVTPSRPVGLANPEAVSSVEQVLNFEAVERTNEVQKPKLKPLHWDKVRASSDRAMVWDQLKSSSFQ